MTFDKMGNFTFDHSNQQDDLYKVKSAQEIKNAFDSRGNELKEALNRLIDQLGSSQVGNSAASNIGVTPFSTSPNNLQGMIEWLKVQIDNVVLGQIPESTVVKPREFNEHLIDKMKHLNNGLLEIKNPQTNISYLLKMDNEGLYLEEV